MSRSRVGVEPTLRNIETVLRMDSRWTGVLAYEELHQQVWLRRCPPYELVRLNGRAWVERAWDDTDTGRTITWLEAQGLSTWREPMVYRAVEMVAKEARYNVLTSWLAGLAWDGLGRLDTWASAVLGTPDTAYARAVGAKWLISAVARAFEPGCQVDHMLVLEGPQSVGKSTVLRILGGAWYVGHLPPVESQRAIEVIRGAWIVEIDELDAFRGASGTRVKSFISRQKDKYRPPYAHHTVTYGRTCVFAGTTNAHDWLTDETGNRRFWPIEAPVIDTDLLAAHRDQLWAEAVARYRGPAATAAWYPTSNWERALLAEQQASRMIEDPWQQRVTAWLRAQHRSYVRPAEVLTGLGIPVDQQHAGSYRRVRAILLGLGWLETRIRVGHGSYAERPRVFVPPGTVV